MLRAGRSPASSRDETAVAATTSAPTGATARELPVRPDIFISYSRSDEHFVSRLAAALEARGKDVWVDLSDIRKGADWQAKMLSGVESARVVVPVISPAFTRSEPCAQEIEHAVAHHKRLVPIVRHSVDRRSLRAELTAPNWIFFDDEGRFEAEVAELVEAADADFDWLDQHARLLTRALEWNRADDRVKPSLLLRGRDLRAAEDWLALQGEHPEGATPAQIDYIVASRRGATRRQQITIGAVALALAVAIGLAILALLQRSQAIHASNLAGSRELAVESTAALGEDPELALLLATKAVAKARTTEATAALRAALDESRVRVRLEHGSPVESAVYSPDGSTILTASEDGTLHTWRARDGRPQLTLHAYGEVHAASFRPDGRVLATSSTKGDTGYVEIWNLRDGNRVRRWTHPDFGWDAVFAPDGRHISTRTFFGSVDLWRFVEGRLRFVRGFGVRSLKVRSAEFSPDGRRLLTTGDDDNVDPTTQKAHFARVLDTRTGKVMADMRDLFALGISARFSPDGRFVVTTGFSRFARVWDAGTGGRVGDLVGHQDTLSDARFSPDGRLIVTASQDGTARIWDAHRRRLLLVLRGHVGPVATASFSPDGRSVLTAGADGTARVWDVSGVLAPQIRAYISAHTISMSADGTIAAVGGKERAAVWDIRRQRQIGTIELTVTTPVDVVVSPTDRYVLAANANNGNAKLWDVRRRRPVARFDGVSGIDADPFSADETRLLVRTNDGFGVWDIRAKRFLLRRSNPTGDSFDVGALSPDGRTAIAGPLGSVWAWDVGSGRGSRLFSIGDAEEADLAAFSPDGSRLVAGAASPSSLGTTGGPVLWEVAKRRRIATLNGHTSSISRVSFSPDGRRILTAAEDETARLWDGRTGAPLAVIGSHTEDVTSASFSPDGRFIVTTSGDDAIRIADGVTGAPVAVVRTGRGGVFAAAFVGETTQLVATHAGGRPWLVRCRLCAPLDDLLALARRRTTRDLTRAERAKYLHE